MKYLSAPQTHKDWIVYCSLGILIWISFYLSERWRNGSSGFAIFSLVMICFNIVALVAHLIRYYREKKHPK
jgi:hypothetical protein